MIEFADITLSSQVLLLALVFPYHALFWLFGYFLFYRVLWLKKYLLPWMKANNLTHQVLWTIPTLLVGPLPFYIFLDPKIEGATIIDYYASYPFGQHPLKWFVQKVYILPTILILIILYFVRLLLP